MARVLVSVTNDLVNDQRVHKVCSSLAAEAWEVCLIGRRLKDSASIDNRTYQTRRFRLLFNKGALFYAEYNLRLFFFLLFTKSDVLHSNDLDTLLANFLVAKLRRKHLVYDTHEYFTGVPELQSRPLVRGIWKRIESWIFPHLNHLFTVNESIASIYVDEYNKSLIPIRNIPLKVEEIKPIERSELGYSPSDFLLVNQGTGINIDRGMEELMEALRNLPSNVKLILIGKGDVIPKLKKEISNSELKARVQFIDPLPYAEMMRITAMCDLGLSLDKDNNVNYRFSLPNKIFDYIRAGIPSLCTNLPELRNIIERYGNGILLERCEPEQIKKGIEKARIEGKPSFLGGIKKASKELYWEKEVLPMLDTYEKFRIGNNRY
jgi:glycosyltransferase involved in cell wall biosynthesis